MKCNENEHYIYFARLTVLDRPLLISLFLSVDLKTYTFLTYLLQFICQLFIFTEIL